MKPYRVLVLRLIMIGFVLTGMSRLTTGQSSNNPLEQGFRQAARCRQANGVVALDEWQHQQGRHQAGPGVDASRGPARLPELRCRPGDAAGGRSSPGVHDSGVEGRLQICDYSCRSIGNGRGDRGLSGLERNGRTLGSGSAGNEEVCLERDLGRRRQAIQRDAGSSAIEHRRISEYGRSRCSWPRRQARRRLRSSMPTPP